MKNKNSRVIKLRKIHYEETGRGTVFRQSFNQTRLAREVGMIRRRNQSCSNNNPMHGLVFSLFFLASLLAKLTAQSLLARDLAQLLALANREVA